MRFIRTIALLIPVLLAGALPSLAAEPTPTAASEVAPVESAPAQPLDFPWLLPEPTLTAGQKPGPCSVSVPCRFGPAVACSGQTVCYWQYDSKYIRGYVSCDGSWAYCPTTLEP